MNDLTKQLFEQMLKLATSSELRKQQIKKGLEQIKKFNWKETATNLLKRLETL